MDELNVQQLVEAVTKQVLAAIEAGGQAAAAQEGKEKILVIGDPSHVPEVLIRNAAVYPLEDYKTARNILRYQKVILGELTLAQLADIALGRDGDAVSCAAVQALLNGVEVWMLEEALPHRKCAGKGNSSLYQMLEGYVRTLQVFGVKLADRDKLCRPAEKPAAPPKFQAPAPAVPKGTACPNSGRLITETMALEMLEQAGETVRLARGTILTPSARDVFTRARVRVEQET